jgi:hypothetical protein
MIAHFKHIPIEIILIISGIAIGLLLGRSCNGSNEGEISHSDVSVRVTIDSIEYLEPIPTTTLKTTLKAPTFKELQPCQIAYDTIYTAYNDTNIYYIDSLGVSAELSVTQNKLHFARFTVESKETTITNTIVAKNRNKVLISVGVNYPFGGYVGAGFQHRNGTIVQYNYSTLGVHSVGVMQAIRFKK